MTDCPKCHGDRVILAPMDTRDAGMPVYHVCGCVTAEVEALEEHIAKLNGIIERLSCAGDHCLDEPRTPYRLCCQVCKAKIEAGVVTK